MLPGSCLCSIGSVRAVPPDQTSGGASAPSGAPRPDAPQAIVILGCRLQNGAPGGALRRRLEQGLRVHQQSPHLPVIMSGGKKWDEIRECRAMTEWWHQHATEGTPAIEEFHSLTTRQNSHWVAKLSREHGFRHVILITCDFHMRRAQRIFEDDGLRVTPQVASHTRSLSERLRLGVREWGADLLRHFEPRLR